MGAISAVGVESAHSGEWDIIPSASVTQSVTDNARSVNTGKEADLITTATAGIAINGNGRRAQLDFSYDISKDIFWDNSELNGVRNSLLGAGNFELWEDHIFIDTRASITQQSLARTGGQTASDRGAGTNDQSVVVNYSITPNFAHRYGNWAESDIIVAFSETRFLESDTGTASTQPDASRSYDVTTLLRSGPKFTQLTWELNGNRTFTSDDTNRQTAELSGEYAVNRHVAVLARAGQETIDNSGINADNGAEFFWRGGFRLTPGPRSSIRLETGRRFGVSTFSGDASYQISSRTALTATYEEEVLTDRQLLNSNLGNLVRDPISGLLINPATGQLADPNSLESDFQEQTTLQKNFSIALTGASGRNTFAISGTGNVREDLTANTEDVTVGLTVTLDRRIWPNLDGGVNGNVSSTIQSASGAEDVIFNSGAFLTYTLGQNFSGTLRYDYLNRDSQGEIDDVEENAISLSLQKQF
ncbi:MAG: TIGR03016 family PEP-CTERM system-associated outer membrane protein [Rhodospirillaceae bacterium]|nr:TIGR03016 family PEP-CTERM system-associated outer membrane protein [Rhodospirillaceae bacterium]MBT5666528.1 TIGR03016 family PEP-CTERM system-associated outer membrane protein [Rhodospirillaceae bacterium]MBT5811706.1 TIGR03016 family PEP-CTERM system-associated outer membrane protein [Rhodospirillaceae bacterium]